MIQSSIVSIWSEASESIHTPIQPFTQTLTQGTNPRSHRRTAAVRHVHGKKAVAAVIIGIGISDRTTGRHRVWTRTYARTRTQDAWPDHEHHHRRGGWRPSCHCCYWPCCRLVPWWALASQPEPQQQQQHGAGGFNDAAPPPPSPRSQQEQQQRVPRPRPSHAGAITTATPKQRRRPMRGWYGSRRWTTRRCFVLGGSCGGGCCPGGWRTRCSRTITGACMCVFLLTGFGASLGVFVVTEWE